MNYKLKLDLFEGPLDLLLYLVKKNDIDITNIPIASVTEQYMEYIEMMQMLDLDHVGDFLVMAATLMQIKSKMLLPPDPLAEKAEEEDPRSELARRLLEYQQFKEVAEALKLKESQRQDLFERKIDEEKIGEIKEESKEVFFEASLFDLINALSHALKSKPEGVGTYEVKIDASETLNVPGKDVALSHPYALPPQAPGTHTVHVRAVDQAGNSSEATATFEVAAIAAPRIKYYPERLYVGDPLTIDGQTYPDATVQITLTAESGGKQVHTVASNSNGFFVIIWPDPLPVGSYHFTAKVTDAHGANSDESSPKSFVVRNRAFLFLSAIATQYLVEIIILLAVLFTLLYVVYYGIHHLVLLRRKLRRDVADVGMSAKIAFRHLRDDVQKYLRLLERAQTKRELTKEEDRIARLLKKDLDDAEAMIEKKIKDVEKDIT